MPMPLGISQNPQQTGQNCEIPVDLYWLAVPARPGLLVMGRGILPSRVHSPGSLCTGIQVPCPGGVIS